VRCEELGEHAPQNAPLLPLLLLPLLCQGWRLWAIGAQDAETWQKSGPATDQQLASRPTRSQVTESDMMLALPLHFAT
jgi:hypothetical protein